MQYETIVIGAGQAGLAMGYYLKQHNHRFLIVDKGQVLGEVWKNRYDSLKLFTPRMYSSLPGLILDGEQQGFPSKDEIANYIKYYTETFALPVELDTEVLSVTKNEEGFCVETTKGTFSTKNVVIATGPFQKKRIPRFSTSLHKDILQLHSSEYKNPKQLLPGNVLVVGGGNSGAQIAVELSEEKDTYLSISKEPNYFPLTIGGRSVFWWLDKLGILKATNTSFIGNLLQKRGDPIFGNELKKAVQECKVMFKGRAVNGEYDRVTFEDSTALKVKNIIWATGFQQEYEWLKVDGVFDQEKKILHNRGISPVKGVYFLGLPWQSRRGSSLLQGVGFDARYLVEYMKNTNV